MRIAYLILCHAHPEQLGRLCQQLDQNDACLYIHVDANTSATQFAQMQAVVPAGARFITREHCRWGGFSLVSASLQLIRAALADECDYMVLLSAQDYPLKTAGQIAKKLEQASGYIEFRRQPDPEFDIRYRYQNYHPELLKGTLAGRLLQKIQRPLHRAGLLKRSLPAPLQAIYSGSQWWCLSARACQALISFCDSHPAVVKFFRSTLVPDEMFVQTILLHTFIAGELVNDSLHQLEWETGAWSPRTFNLSDLPGLLTSPALFARKFSPDGILTQKIDEHLNTR